MTQTISPPPEPAKAAGRIWASYWSWLIAAAVVVAAIVVAMNFMLPTEPSDSAMPDSGRDSQRVEAESIGEPSTATAGSTVLLPPERWQSAGVRVATVQRGPFVETVKLTGKVALNEDRIAHIYPLVEGTVDEVFIGLGQEVSKAQPLVVVHSREVGAAKLALYQARQQLELAKVKETMQREITDNSRALLAVLRARAPIAEIEARFRNRSMGEFREQLLLAYARFLKSAADVERLSGPAESGAISGKLLLAAQSNQDADLAAFQARIEQVEFELKTSLLQASQSLNEAQTQVAVAEASLRILGCRDEDIAMIDPSAQGEALSHYSILAPFEGTIISKDVAFKEQVRPDVEILQIADLSTVWIAADIYEKDVPLLNSLGGKPIRVRNEAWPDQTFEAHVFFTGEIMDPRTRTISLRAIAENPQRLLKPGMFVTVEFESASKGDVLTVPIEALQEHEGRTFVFVQVDDDRFEPTDIVVGQRDEKSAVVSEGLHEQDRIAVQGGFILKTKLLENLLGED